MKPSEVRAHLLQKDLHPLSESTLTALYAAVHDASQVRLIAGSGSQDMEIKDDLLFALHHLLMARWQAEYEYHEEEREKINYSEFDTFVQPIADPRSPSY